MSRALKFLMFIYAVVFLTTGAFMVFIVNADEMSPQWVALLARNHTIVFAWHLACWMVLGMFTNYYWDLFNQGKGMESMQVPRILIPMLVSPFVFMPTYNLWLASSSQSFLLFLVIAIQAGFFWHALFTKADQTLSKSSNIPWSVNNGNRTTAKAAPVTPALGPDGPR
jgi:hypothetical protein